jgi:hypothetical protein
MRKIFCNLRLAYPAWSADYDSLEIGERKNKQDSSINNSNKKKPNNNNFHDNKYPRCFYQNRGKKNSLTTPTTPPPKIDDKNEASEIFLLRRTERTRRLLLEAEFSFPWVGYGKNKGHVSSAKAYSKIKQTWSVSKDCAISELSTSRD